MFKRLLCACIALVICWGFLLPAGAANKIPAAVEEAMERWKQELLARYEHFPSLQIEFSQESETVKDRYLRVDCHCTLSLEGLSHPLTTERSFHVSMRSGKLLDLEDLLINGGSAQIQRGLAEETGANPSVVNWKLTEEGLTLYPSRGIGASGLALEEEVLSQVLIWDGSVIWPNRPMLALTFDDGPSGKTPRLLDILDAHGARATFFVVGNMVGGRHEILQRMCAAGHEIGGHTWNHANLTELDWDAVYTQLMWTKNSIDSATGTNSRLMRPPYGASNGNVSSAAGALGLSVTFWTLDTLDWLYLNADRVCDIAVNQATDGCIILCHDLYDSTIDAMERAIPALLKQGYQLVTVSELRSR